MSDSRYSWDARLTKILEEAEAKFARPSDTELRLCPWALKFSIWAEQLLQRCRALPTHLTLRTARSALLQQYTRAFFTVPAYHHQEALADGHDCLHRILLLTSVQLEHLELWETGPQLAPAPAPAPELHMPDMTLGEEVPTEPEEPETAPAGDEPAPAARLGPSPGSVGAHLM